MTGNNRNMQNSSSRRQVPVGEMTGANSAFQGIVSPSSFQNIRRGSAGANAIVSKPVAPLENPKPDLDPDTNGVGGNDIAQDPVQPIQPATDK